MRAERNKELPFKMKNKKVFDRKIDGPNVLVMGLPDEEYVSVKPQDCSDKFDKSVVANISDKAFVLEGWIANEKFYAADILYYDDEDLRDLPWNDRYKYLRNKFDWNYTARLSRPIVIAADSQFDKEEEVRDAAMIFKKLPHTEGMIVRNYDSSYYGDRKFIPVSEMDDIDG